MTSTEKKVIFSIIGILVIVLIVVLILKGVHKNQQLEELNSNQYVTSFEDIGSDVKLNSSADLNAPKKYKDIEITNIQFSSQGQSSTLLADVKNTGAAKHEEEIVSIVFFGEDDTVITTLDSFIPSLNPGETGQLTTLVTADIVNAKNFTIQEKQ